MTNKSRILINNWTLTYKGTSFINDDLGYRITLVTQKNEKDTYCVYDLILNKHIKTTQNLAKAFLYVQNRVRCTEF